MSIRDQFIAALLKRGERQIADYPSRRYVVFTRTIQTIQDGFYFVGKSGGLRRGSTITGSVPVSPRERKEILS